MDATGNDKDQWLILEKNNIGIFTTKAITLIELRDVNMVEINAVRYRIYDMHRLFILMDDLLISQLNCGMPTDMLNYNIFTLNIAINDA